MVVLFTRKIRQIPYNEEKNALDVQPLKYPCVFMYVLRFHHRLNPLSSNQPFIFLHMKTILHTLLFIAGLSLVSFAQAQDWQDSYTEAKALSEETDKPLLVLFTGSDWCKYCISLDEMVWQNESFGEYSAENFVLYLADFPRRSENKLPKELQDEHNALAKTFGVTGFPTVIVVGSDGEVAGTIEGDGGHDDYDSFISGLTEIIEDRVDNDDLEEEDTDEDNDEEGK